MNFEQWLVSIGKSEKTAHNYSQAITGSISTWATKAGVTNEGLDSVQSLADLNALLPAIQALDTFQQRNTKGNGMYSAALKLYARYLDEISEENVADDIGQILTDETIPETEKKTFINARIGQGKFRDELYDYWGGCSVTKFSQKRLLVASHIKPWKVSTNQERLDTYNGLLLIPNLDKVFDLGFVTFEPSGRIRISDALEMPEVLGIESAQKVSLADRHQDYMAYHREKRFGR